MTDLLRVEGLSAGYGEVGILKSVSLAVAAGTITALIGGNGAGKTTLMLTLAGLLAPAAGRIQFDGQELAVRPSHERVDAGLALVPEGRRVFPSLSVEENLRLGAIVPRSRATWTRRRDDMFALFPRLVERRRQLAGTLSGGEQQMLAIARGLMAMPKLLLLDEPTLGLAPIIASSLFALIRDLNGRGLTILIAEQDIRRTLAIAHHAYVIENGGIVMSGGGDELSRDPRVRSAYLGL
ncbi:MAG: ABC transporter ATP-binding protein [Alphaproteobacteria bacterium]|nr:ABC transporter ATP-binding protein [Alphaproteobacteria bacterium]